MESLQSVHVIAYKVQTQWPLSFVHTQGNLTNPEITVAASPAILIMSRKESKRTNKSVMMDSRLAELGQAEGNNMISMAIVAGIAATLDIREFYVIPNAGTSVEEIATIGKVLKREHELYTMSMTSSQFARASKLHKLVHVRRKDQQPDMGSVKSLDKFVKAIKLEAQAARRKPRGLGGTEGYLWYLKQRAYPNDRIDYDAYAKAAGHRDRMPAPKTGALDSSSWSYLGPTNLETPYRTYWGLSPVNGRINAAAWDPVNADTLWVGAPMGGVWKSTDAGANWTPRGDDFSYLPISSLAVNPLNPDWVYAGTGDFDGGYGYGHGIMHTMDGGATWTEYGAADFGTLPVTALTLHPSNPLIVCAATGSRSSTSGGYIWRNTLGGTGVWTKAIATSAKWTDLRVGTTTPGGARVYWAAGVGVTGNLLYRSVNAGSTWSSIALPAGLTPQTRLKIAPSKLDYQTLYLLAPSSQKIYKTVNSGSTWSDITSGFPNGTTSDPTYNWSQVSYDATIETSVYGSTVIYDSIYVGLIDVAQSVDGGSTWNSIGGPTWTSSAQTHNDQHTLVAHPQTPNLMLVGNDGGIYKFWDAGAVDFWFNLNERLGVTQFYHADHHPTDGDVMLGGTQDNATPLSLGDLLNWENVGGGDGGGCAINLVEPGIQYATSQNYGYNSSTGDCQLFTTSDFWGSSYSHSYNIGTEPTSFIGNVKINRALPIIVYTATNRLYAHIWNPLSHVTTRFPQQLCSSGSVTEIGTARSDANVIYTGASNGEVWMTNDGGSNWTQISTGLPVRSITDINVHPNDPYDVLVTVSGTGVGHVWHCENTSATTPLWVDCSALGTSTLPDLPVNCIERSMYGPEDTWWVGTDNGVYMTPSEGVFWLNINPLGLPNVQVNDITSVIGNSHMFAATFGRGMWKINIYDPNDAVTGNGGATARVNAESTATATVNVDHPAPDTGTEIMLESDSIAASVPSSTYVWFNSDESDYPITTYQVCMDPVLVNITARLGTSTHVYSFTVDPLSNLLPVTNYVVTRGEEFEGTLTSLLCTDGDVLSIFNDPTSLEASVDFLTTGAPVPPTLLEFYWTSRVGRPGLSEQLTMLDRVSGTYTVLTGRVATTRVSPFNKKSIATPGRYVTPGGAIRARLTWRPINDEDPAADGWLHSVDFAAFRAVP